ncbi:MAG TPA: response regulator FixJ [Alphaproteobacteria bacterium]|jgi:RNA polymerase sigma factor (sigma-70 family)|nr:response regulator FixJ [Alphaproteobacteria bacterium]
MPEAAPIVYVVDDDEAVRDSLALLFESEGLDARAFASADEVLDKLERERPGCIVADVRMPGMSGVELLETLKAQHAAIPIILITGHGDVPMAVAALKAGAADFFEKPFDEALLVSSVRAALDRTHEERRRVVEDEELRARLASLTAREREVMDLIVAGHSNKMVAARLAISPRTVEVYRARVMEKMQARSLADVVRMAIRLDGADT